MRRPIARAVAAGTFCLLWCAAAGGQEPPFCGAAADLAAAGDHDAAVELLAAVSGEDRPWADHCRGRVESDRDALDAAIEAFAAAVEARPESPVFQRLLGEAYIDKLDTVGTFAKLGLAKKAQKAFEEAVRLAPADADARLSLVEFYLNAPPIAGGSRDKAAAQVAELEKLDPALGKALQGRLHVNEGEWADAEAAYRAALEISGDNAEYHYLIGFSQQQQERYDAAVASFEKALELDPGKMSAAYQLGRTAVLSGSNVERGVECLQTFLERPAQRGNPGKEHAWWRLGMLRELQGERQAAAAAYREALAIDPDHEEATRALAALDG